MRNQMLTTPIFSIIISIISNMIILSKAPASASRVTRNIDQHVADKLNADICVSMKRV